MQLTTRLPWLCVLLMTLTWETALRADEPTDAPRLRVMCYNVHHGRGMDGNIDLPRIAKVINDADVDLVALQEVDIRTGRSGGVDQLAELARLTKMHASFAKGRDYDGGDYGQAILSRMPIESIEVHRLPGATELEQRIAGAARIRSERGLPDLLFVTTHLHHQSEPDRLAQAAHLNELLAPHRASPLILTGDINAMPHSKVLQFFAQDWVDLTPEDALTFPADKPNRKIDYIFLPKGHRWRVVHAEVIAEPMASDHRPIVAELQWLGGD
jgi:endonuclease/exonuclease/phosphatase family metal-dependent hydrolase